MTQAPKSTVIADLFGQNADSPQSDAERMFEELIAQQEQVPLGPEHERLIEWLRDNGAAYFWDSDRRVLVTKTTWLQEARKALRLKGLFVTESTSSERACDTNCFAFPIRRGAWVVRRSTPGVQEESTWSRDRAGWTRTYLNREPDLRLVSQYHAAVEDTDGGFSFLQAESAQKAAFELGADIKLPVWALTRQAKLKNHKDGSLIVEIAHESTDNGQQMTGWIREGKIWYRIYDVKAVPPIARELGNYDDLVRHLVSESDEDRGWVVKSDQSWRVEPLTHVKPALKSIGLSPKEADLQVGGSVLRPWTIVNRPFQPEYPGDRTWNRGAQFAYFPSTDLARISHPTWTRILKHVGSGLDQAVRVHPWCKTNGILTGADYLRCWVASLLQEPMQPLPYLFLYSREQNTGESIFHEALGVLIKGGVVRADKALVNRGGFNGELENAVLCVVEETSLNRNSPAYNRINDWVTSRQLPLHRKYYTPYMIPNSTHWVQTANDRSACPVFPGDTRITIIRVPVLAEIIPKGQLMAQLKKEGPDILAALLSIVLPPSDDRLNLPVVATEEKLAAERANRTMLQAFMAENVYEADGKMIRVSEFFDRFQKWLDPGQRWVWTKARVDREMPAHFPKGRRPEDGHLFWGNLSWEARKPGDPILPKLVRQGDMLVSS